MLWSDKYQGKEKVNDVGVFKRVFWEDFSEDMTFVNRFDTQESIHGESNRNQTWEVVRTLPLEELADQGPMRSQFG